MGFKSRVKSRVGDRWWERRQELWWGEPGGEWTE